MCFPRTAIHIAHGGQEKEGESEYFKPSKAIFPNETKKENWEMKKTSISR